MINAAQWVLSGLLTASLKEEKKKESAYKPGSVENSHSSRQRVTSLLKQSTQESYGPHV